MNLSSIDNIHICRLLDEQDIQEFIFLALSILGPIKDLWTWVLKFGPGFCKLGPKTGFQGPGPEDFTIPRSRWIIREFK